MKPVSPKGKPWIVTGRIYAEVFWPSDGKSWLIGKDPDAGKDWGQEEGTTEDKMVGWPHRLNGYEFEQTLGESEGQGSLACYSPWGCRVRHNWVTEQQQCSIYYMPDTVPSPLYITQQTHITGGLTSPSFHQRGLRHRVSDWAVIKVVVLVSGRVRTWAWAGSRLKLWDFVAGVLTVWLWMCGCYKEGMLGVHHLSNWHAHLHLTSRAETVISLLMLTLI